MKLEDVKHLIDAYFEKVSGEEIIERFETLGYVFEDINEANYPEALIIAEKEALAELHFNSSELLERQVNETYQFSETSFSEMITETEVIKFEFFSNSYDKKSYYNQAA
jgi:hypothetical protein